ncbi:MAG: type VI secretion system membrane subunit TssM [Deltaproteobacteria bacterium]|nr:type VI secretion system membrane subunit TssM [Deltaproteobacteria bacterium]
MLKYILTVLFVVLVWSAAIVLELPLWVPAVVSVLAIVLLVVVVLVQRARARRAASNIEHALSAQAAQQLQSVRPDQHGEIRAMQDEFSKAIKSLKTSKLGGGANALYALPWYMIIGPPGSGKSTALRNSGLNFPYLSQAGGGVRGVGGTRNCEWWLTNEAVVLDTAGRYTTEEEDRDEWFSFLDMLRKNRPEKPVNGVIVAVSVGDVAGAANEEEVQALARRIRERVDEVMARLQMVVPIYLMFTKCDLVPGFVESFGELGKHERGQIWGFTVSLKQKVKDPSELFSQRFDELTKILEQRVLPRMGQERRVDTRERIWQFPQQWEVLKNHCAEFVGALFQQSIYHDSPVMRGVYFSSGTQEGRPIDRVMNAMASAFGVQGRMPQGEPVVDPKSYFLRDVFSKVVFPDALIAARSPAEISRQRRTIALVAGAIFLFAGLFSLLPGYAWLRNRRLLAAARAEVQRVDAHRRTPNAGPITLDLLEPLRSRVSTLQGWSDASPPVGLTLGMYRGEQLLPRVRTFYTRTLRSALIEPIIRGEETQLRQFGLAYERTTAPAPGDEFRRRHKNLKLYLLLTWPKGPGEPVLDDAARTFLTEEVVERWAAALGRPPNSGQREAMRTHVRLYLQLLANDPSIAIQRDAVVVLRARAALTRADVMDLAIEQVIGEIEREGWDLTFHDLTGGAITTPLIQNVKRVRGAFTRRAWTERVRARLRDPIEELLGEPWVLGIDPRLINTVPREQQIVLLRNNYLRRYIAEWRQMLEGLRILRAPNEESAFGMLEDLTRGDPSPWGVMFRHVAINTDLAEQASAADRAGSRLTALAAERARRTASTKLGPAATTAGGSLLRGRGQQEFGHPDPNRPLEPYDVRDTFIALSRFGVPPPTPPTLPGVPPTPRQRVDLDSYVEQLIFVRDALRAFVVDRNQRAPLTTRLTDARRVTTELIGRTEYTAWRPFLSSILMPPIDAAQSAHDGNMGVRGRTID